VKLIRIAIIYLTPARTGWDSWEMRVGRVAVRTMEIGKAPAIRNAKRLLVTSGVLLSAFPVIDNERLIDPPPDERRGCEHGIEIAANTIAVLSRSSCRISSAWPPVAFVPESDEERAYLAGAQGIRYQHQSVIGAASPIPMTSELLRGLTDRFDGVASLADFFATDHALAGYREAARFLEMAFALPTSQMEKKLAVFLTSGPFGYTRAEVASWLLHRHGAMHGDQRKTSSFTWDSDVRPFIDRIEQALLDVLFNKAEWSSSTQVRRAAWTPLYGTQSETGAVFATQAERGTMSLQMLDAWGTFPLDLSSLDPPPPNWWCKIAEIPAGTP
jgi:hypothetical protein